MKPFIILVLSVLICLSCEQKTEHDELSTSALPFNLSDYADKKQFVKSWLSNQYFKSNNEFFLEEIDDSVNEFLIYKIKLGAEWPTAMYSFYTMLYNKNTHKSFIVPIDFTQIYAFDDHLMMGGILSYREFEYFSMYEINTHELRTILTPFETETVKVGYWKDDECEDYVPDRLFYKYFEKDRRIEFSGVIENYCQPNADRLTSQKKPLSTAEVKIVYQFKDGEWVKGL